MFSAVRSRTTHPMRTAGTLLRRRRRLQAQPPRGRLTKWLSGNRAALVFSTRSSEAPVKALSRVSPPAGRLAGFPISRHLQVANPMHRTAAPHSIYVDRTLPVTRTEPGCDLLLGQRRYDIGLQR